MQRNVATLVDLPKVEQLQIIPFTPEEARVFLTAIEGDPHEALYYVALGVGLRQGEILGLQWDDVDLDEGLLTVRHTLQRVNREWRLVPPKTTRSRRTLPLPAIVVAKLREHRAAQRREQLRRGGRPTEFDLVFTSATGTPLDDSNVTHGFPRILAAAGLRRMRFHDLRHSCATFILVQGATMREVMETLGHSQIALTMNTYTHVLPSLQKESAERMNRFLTGSEG